MNCTFVNLASMQKPPENLSLKSEMVNVLLNLEERSIPTSGDLLVLPQKVERSII